MILSDMLTIVIPDRDFFALSVGRKCGVAFVPRLRLINAAKNARKCGVAIVPRLRLINTAKNAAKTPINTVHNAPAIVPAFDFSAVLLVIG